jgi:hypothetical protein
MPIVLVKDIGDAKRKLAKIIREYETNKISTEKFRSLVYGISKYIEAVYKYEIEVKVSQLEEITDKTFNA